MMCLLAAALTSCSRPTAAKASNSWDPKAAAAYLELAMYTSMVRESILRAVLVVTNNQGTAGMGRGRVGGIS